MRDDRDEGVERDDSDERSGSVECVESDAGAESVEGVENVEGDERSFTSREPKEGEACLDDFLCFLCFLCFLTTFLRDEPSLKDEAVNLSGERVLSSRRSEM